MTKRILMVDDEARVLDGLRRSLHGRYDIDVASSGAAGLDRVGANEPYAVVVSDMMMPEMNGAEFLARAHRMSPDTVQMILSGQAELTSTIAAVNEGNIFRFLTKPCEATELARAVDAAMAQYQLVLSERELLERTLDGAVQVLTELMAAANPIAFHRTETVKILTDAVATAIPVTKTWELRIAAMLGQVGLMAVPEEVLIQVKDGSEMTAESLAIYRGHPALAHDLICRIPRLERVAAWVAAQPVSFDDAINPPPDRAAIDEVSTQDDATGEGPTGEDVYATVMAFVVGAEAGIPPGNVVFDLVKTGRYAQDLLDIALKTHVLTTVRRPKRVAGRDLIVGMLMDQDVMTTTGRTLLRSGELLTESMAVRLRHFADGVGLIEPIDVLV
jgi:CheY-like chemotaxis protein